MISPHSARSNSGCPACSIMPEPSIEHSHVSRKHSGLQNSWLHVSSMFLQSLLSLGGQGLHISLTRPKQSPFPIGPPSGGSSFALICSIACLPSANPRSAAAPVTQSQTRVMKCFIVAACCSQRWFAVAANCANGGETATRLPPTMSVLDYPAPMRDALNITIIPARGGSASSARGRGESPRTARLRRSMEEPRAAVARGLRRHRSSEASVRSQPEKAARRRSSSRRLRRRSTVASDGSRKARGLSSIATARKPPAVSRSARARLERDLKSLRATFNQLSTHKLVHGTDEAGEEKLRALESTIEQKEKLLTCAMLGVDAAEAQSLLPPRPSSKAASPTPEESESGSVSDGSSSPGAAAGLLPSPKAASAAAAAAAAAAAGSKGELVKRPPSVDIAESIAAMDEEMAMLRDERVRRKTASAVDADVAAAAAAAIAAASAGGAEPSKKRRRRRKSKAVVAMEASVKPIAEGEAVTIAAGDDVTATAGAVGGSAHDSTTLPPAVSSAAAGKPAGRRRASRRFSIEQLSMEEQLAAGELLSEVEYITVSMACVSHMLDAVEAQAAGVPFRM
eukprot:PLAT12551.20.p1 GENE.PLAT12551.20~~PLAT12551.20.p1  ORF type:complete len:567 (-),score=176.56 PLAT12551.20:105-1805(-)